MNNNGYDFPVQLQPVFLGNGQEITNRKAVVRTDTMQTLGVVSNDYGLVQHRDVIDTFREASSDLRIEEKISLTNDGGNLFYEMLFPKVETEVQKGDIVRMRMIIKNSYNGMNSLNIIFGALRLVCLNGMVVGMKLLTFQYRHTKNIEVFAEDSLDKEAVRESLQQYIQHFSTSMRQLTTMAKKPLELNDGLFDKKEVMLPAYLLDEAKQSFERERDETVWGYYNALTYAVTHKMKKESPASSIEYGKVAWRAAERML